MVTGGRRPRDRAIQRPVDLEDAGVIAEALKLAPVACGQPPPGGEGGGGPGGMDGGVQMPPGVPVAGVAVGAWGARNAGYLAASILALKHPDIRESYKAFRDKQSQG